MNIYSSSFHIYVTRDHKSVILHLPWTLFSLTFSQESHFSCLPPATSANTHTEEGGDTEKSLKTSYFLEKQKMKYCLAFKNDLWRVEGFGRSFIGVLIVWKWLTKCDVKDDRPLMYFAQRKGKKTFPKHGLRVSMTKQLSCKDITVSGMSLLSNPHPRMSDTVSLSCLAKRSYRFFLLMENIVNIFKGFLSISRFVEYSRKRESVDTLGSLSWWIWLRLIEEGLVGFCPKIYGPIET